MPKLTPQQINQVTEQLAALTQKIVQIGERNIRFERQLETLEEKNIQELLTAIRAQLDYLSHDPDKQKLIAFLHKVPDLIAYASTRDKNSAKQFARLIRTLPNENIFGWLLVITMYIGHESENEALQTLKQKYSDFILYFTSHQFTKAFGNYLRRNEKLVSGEELTIASSLQNETESWHIAPEYMLNAQARLRRFMAQLRKAGYRKFYDVLADNETVKKFLRYDYEKLDQTQKRLNYYISQAQSALESGDWKTFEHNVVDRVKQEVSILRKLNPEIATKIELLAKYARDSPQDWLNGERNQLGLLTIKSQLSYKTGAVYVNQLFGQAKITVLDLTAKRTEQIKAERTKIVATTRKMAENRLAKASHLCRKTLQRRHKHLTRELTTKLSERRYAFEETVGSQNDHIQKQIELNRKIDFLRGKLVQFEREKEMPNISRRLELYRWMEQVLAYDPALLPENYFEGVITSARQLADLGQTPQIDRQREKSLAELETMLKSALRSAREVLKKDQKVQKELIRQQKKGKIPEELALAA